MNDLKKATMFLYIVLCSSLCLAPVCDRDNIPPTIQINCAIHPSERVLAVDVLFYDNSALRQASYKVIVELHGNQTETESEVKNWDCGDGQPLASSNNVYLLPDEFESISISAFAFDCSENGATESIVCDVVEQTLFND